MNESGHLKIKILEDRNFTVTTLKIWKLLEGNWLQSHMGQFEMIKPSVMQGIIVNVNRSVINPG